MNIRLTAAGAALAACTTICAGNGTASLTTDKRQHTTADKNSPPANEDMKRDSKQLNIHAANVDSSITKNEHK